MYRLRHLKLESCNVEERTLVIEDILPNGMDKSSVIGRAYDKLSQTLRMIKDLPLLIADIHPISEYLRRTAVSSYFFISHKIVVYFVNKFFFFIEISCR